MRLVLALCLVAGGAAADCLPAGKTPARVMFDDGQMVDGIRRSGDRLSYKSALQPGMVVTTETRWAIWPMRSSYPGNKVTYDWAAALPAPRDLVPGKAVTVPGTMEMTGAPPRDYPMTVRLIGPDKVNVAGCDYDVLHLWVRMGPEKGQRVEGERWLDPARMVVWAQTTKVYGEDGKLAADVAARAILAEP